MGNEMIAWSISWATHLSIKFLRMS